MRAFKFTLPLVLLSALSGCAVYGPAPVAYEQPYYQPAPVYAAPAPAYAAPAYPPPVWFGLRYRSGPRWHHGHYH